MDSIQKKFYEIEEEVNGLRDKLYEKSSEYMKRCGGMLDCANTIIYKARMYYNRVEKEIGKEYK